MSDAPLFGKYRAVVINNVDPLQIGRIQVMVPDVGAVIPTSWAMPCLPTAGINAGFFTVCTNSTKPQTMHCMHPPSDNNGTGYETTGSPIPVPGAVPGGSTGWLSTTAPISPGEDVTLRFVIFDEGDGVLDSAVLLDNFQWGAATVMGPSTGPIGYKIIKHHRQAPLSAPMCLSPVAHT